MKIKVVIFISKHLFYTQHLQFNVSTDLTNSKNQTLRVVLSAKEA